MMPAPSGTGFAVAVVVWGALLIVGFVAIAVGVGRVVNRRTVGGVGHVVGPLVACGWVWLLIRIDHVGLLLYALVFAGIPIGGAALARREARAG